MNEPAPFPKPGPWQQATVTEIRRETARAKTFRLALSTPVEHLPGQHFVVRLRAPDGYQASRSYSVASPPDGSAHIELTVERLDDGEVSSFLHDVVMVGDQLEVRGPIGGWFVWDGTTPALLLGGGSGVVPLMSMLRSARRAVLPGQARLVVSVRSPADLYYPTELPGPDTTVVYTRSAPPGAARAPGHLSATDLPAWANLPATTTVYVCGSSGFADAATDLLTSAGAPAAQIRVERFGPTS